MANAFLNKNVLENPKKILITGVSKGIGLALAEEFANLGHIILGCSTSSDKIKEIKKKFSTPHQLEAIDVSSDKQVASWAKYLLSIKYIPDIIINNAAIINDPAFFWNIPQNDFDRLIQINIIGTANVLRHFLPSMIEQKKGAIINMSSDWGRSISPKVLPYCTSKWAIEGFTKALSTELPKGMASVSLSPGIVATAMLKSCFPEGIGSAPTPKKWAQTAAIQLLEINENDNGKELTIAVPT